MPGIIIIPCIKSSKCIHNCNLVFSEWNVPMSHMVKHEFWPSAWMVPFSWITRYQTFNVECFPFSLWKWLRKVSQPSLHFERISISSFSKREKFGETRRWRQIYRDKNSNLFFRRAGRIRITASISNAEIPRSTFMAIILSTPPFEWCTKIYSFPLLTILCDPLVSNSVARLIIFFPSTVY